MDYLSTRDTALRPALIPFAEMVFAGPAPDGGLYMPKDWPDLSPTRLRALAGKPYAEVAEAVLAPFFVGPDLTSEDLRILCDAAYGPFSTFRHPEVTPLVRLDDDLQLLELFHGPTLAFKDVALQLLGKIFDHLLAKQKRTVTIIGATSGDTGSAAIAGCMNMKNARIVILHPAGRVSEIQRRQMTTTGRPNVFNIALDGTFDDAQAAVKALFTDRALSNELGLTAINSINWARIAAQCVYYVTAALACGAPERPVSFAVPTGNFGNVFAAHAARIMGVPIDTLVVGSNRNDILTRFFATGEMAVDKVVPSLSPSMDIQVSSNFERYLFEILRRDARATGQIMAAFKDRGFFALTPADHARALAGFAGYSASDDDTIATMHDVFEKTGMLIDPHTAVGIHAARRFRADRPSDTPMIALACAHPAKFPDAVKRATSRIAPLPEHLKDLMSLTERLVPMRNDIGILKNYIRGVCAA